MDNAAAKNEEILDVVRKRLIFRSLHRGTKEMDVILGSFADQNIRKFDKRQLFEYEEILTRNDADLYLWITGKKAPPERIAKLEVFKLLQKHKYV